MCKECESMYCECEDRNLEEQDAMWKHNVDVRLDWIDYGYCYLDELHYYNEPCPETLKKLLTDEVETLGDMELL
jgi:hypothetical protein